MAIRVAATLSLVEHAGSAGASAKVTGCCSPIPPCAAGSWAFPTAAAATGRFSAAGLALRASAPVSDGRTALEFEVASE
jgi:hypothetical protein